MRGRSGAVAALLLALGTPGLSRAQPANDACTAPTVITSIPFTDSVDAAAATEEPTDPPLRCFGDEPGEATLWWSYTASEDVELLLDTEGSGGDPIVSVHRGTCGALVESGCSDDEDDAQPVPVGVAAGETILIQVSEGDPVTLNVRHPAPGTPIMLGAEFQVNTHTDYDQGGYLQRGVSVCAGAGGTFVVVWQDDDGEDGDDAGIFAQRYDSTGAPAGAEFQVNAYTTWDQQEPAVACDGNGDFVVVWRGSGPGTDHRGVHGRRFHADGTPKGSDFAIGEGATTPVGLASDPAGNFLVAWDDSDGDETVHARAFDATGAALTDAFEASPVPPPLSPKAYPAVSADGAGGFVVVWQSDEGDGDGYGVFGRRFDATGTPLGGEFQVNVETFFDQTRPAVAHDPTGNFLIAWIGGDYEIAARRFDATGTAGPELLVTEGDGPFSYLPAVASQGDDGFVVVWTEGVDDSTDVFGQRLAATGAPIGERFRANSVSLRGDMYEAIARTAGDEFVVAWSSFGADGSHYGVMAQRFRVAAVGAACAPAPLASCRQPAVQHKGRLAMKDKASATGDSLAWRWAKGQATTPADVGDPTTDDGYAFCIYGPDDELLAEHVVAPGGTCGAGPCWQPKGAKGFVYRNRAGNEHGIQKVLLVPGDEGKATVALRGKGAALALPPLPAALPLVAQLQGAHACWGATYESSGVLKNEPRVFAAKASAGAPASAAGSFVD